MKEHDIKEKSELFTLIITDSVLTLILMGFFIRSFCFISMTGRVFIFEFGSSLAVGIDCKIAW